MKVRAPAKLILSGEHAIVYGKPALAMAINRYAEAETTSQRLPIISFDFSDLAYQEALRYATLERLKERIKHKYRRFLRGEFKIREVMQRPVELAQFASSLFFDLLKVRPSHGVKIKIQSDIPMGCGLGSSAAIILAVIHAIANHLKLPLPAELLYRLGLEAENIQHGKSSGLDLRVSQQGGCLFIKNEEIFSRPLPTLPLYLVNTGTPESSTGECVSAAAKHFEDTALGDEFAAVTEAMDQALTAEDAQAFREAILNNHHLLTRIGVVPEKVQRFAKELQESGGAAKICGAGSVEGENAGVVLAVTEDLHKLTELCALYRYTLIPIAPDTRGVHVV